MMAELVTSKWRNILNNYLKRISVLTVLNLSLKEKRKKVFRPLICFLF